MKNLFKDYGVFYKKYLELVKEHRRSVTFVSSIAGVISAALVFTPIVIDKIEDYKIQKLLNEHLEKKRVFEQEES